MQNKSSTRRQFLANALKLTGATAVTSLLPESILRAQSIPAATVTGTIQDVKHVVILMQENRSFDHYLGTLRGVRGFGDPRPTVISSGYPVWRQTLTKGYVFPFNPTPPSGVANGDAYYNLLDHYWAGTHSAWNNGCYDNWAIAKTSDTMYYFTQNDIPFYYALASAFTVCDAYHCSMLGPTDPNRLYLWTGCCGNVPGYTPCTGNKIAGPGWTTLPERLNAAGVTWKFYQDKGNGLDARHGYGELGDAKNELSWNGNYGCNVILNFNQYQNLGASDPLAAALNGTQIDPTGGGQEYDTKLFSQLRADVANDALPQVSWVVAPHTYSEHPACPASGGAWYVSNVLNALTSNPKVWGSTVLLVMYDENDGLFDHVPPAVPASAAAGTGRSTVSTAAEFVASGGATSDGSAKGDVPIGLGPRVPMFVISPWSKGGKVNSQVFDHTSVVRFLEARFGFQETNISPWRRAVCGDLTSAFSFSSADPTVAAIQPPASNMSPNGQATGPSSSTNSMPAQATGRSAACRLPYEFFVQGKVNRTGNALVLTMTNTGTAGVHLQVWAEGTSRIPQHYTIAAGASQCANLSDSLALNSSGAYDYSVYGPNGFLQTFRGSIGSSTNMGSAAEVSLCYDVSNGNVQITLDNTAGSSATTFQLTDNAYGMNTPQSFTVAAGATQRVTWYGDGGWYDVSIRDANDPNFLRRAAGCVQAQTGTLLTDSAIGNTSGKFVATLAAQGSTFSTLRFDYVVPPWSHSPANWVGIYTHGTIPAKGNSLSWAPLPKSAGSLLFSSTANQPVKSSGQYDAWYLFDGGYTTLAGPVTINI
ncbi:phospholipase C, phosphocholine-specific [Burkholderia territorii]|uniref:phosphocholine-specific phospholipase C n=1 Tax=Burkholderia territorii TaxID=1503055 RepID=UPI00075F48FA|nr:phospholipase C, phosphocholine-specific [Burkholderia territorii]KVT78855.1 phospholipase C, phosphocholine-specific [Burkholderia territorii]